MKRCVSAFATFNRVVAAGDLFEDDDPLVLEHAPFFADVSSPPRAILIPGTDKVPFRQYPDQRSFIMSTSDNDNVEPRTPSERESGLPVSTQSGPGAAEAERRQAEENDRDDEARDDEDTVDGGVERRVHTQSTVEEATANPGEKRQTRRS